MNQLQRVETVNLRDSSGQVAGNQTGENFVVVDIAAAENIGLGIVGLGVQIIEVGKYKGAVGKLP